MESKQGELYERLGFNLSLNRLFSECHFHVTGINADMFQMKVQELTEAKLNIGIPAYAHTIVRALKDGALHENSEILLGPVGKGSLALNNTALGFAERFASRLYEEINYLLHLDPAFEGTEYTGNIRLLTNNDTEKLSVAQGMIDMKEHVHERAEIIVSGEPTDTIWMCFTEAVWMQITRQKNSSGRNLPDLPERQEDLSGRQNKVSFIKKLLSSWSAVTLTRSLKKHTNVLDIPELKMVFTMSECWITGSSEPCREILKISVHSCSRVKNLLCQLRLWKKKCSAEL